MNAVLGIDTDRVANASGALKIKYVSSLVPGERVVLDIVLAIIDDERTMFHEKLSESGAAGAAIKPHDDGVILWIRQ